MKKHYYPFGIFFALLLITTAGCTGGEREQAPEPAGTEAPVYTVKGRFLQFDEENQTISVVHEEIPGVMRSMRMNLRLDDPDEVASLKPGDVITFELTRRGASWFVYGIEVLPEDTVLELPENLRDPGL